MTNRLPLCLLGAAVAACLTVVPAHANPAEPLALQLAQGSLRAAAHARSAAAPPVVYANGRTSRATPRDVATVARPARTLAFENSFATSRARLDQQAAARFAALTRRAAEPAPATQEYTTAIAAPAPQRLAANWVVVAVALLLGYTLMRRSPAPLPASLPARSARTPSSRPARTAAVASAPALAVPADTVADGLPASGVTDGAEPGALEVVIRESVELARVRAHLAALQARKLDVASARTLESVAELIERSRLQEAEAMMHEIELDLDEPMAHGDMLGIIGADALAPAGNGPVAPNHELQRRIQALRRWSATGARQRRLAQAEASLHVGRTAEAVAILAELESGWGLAA